MSKKFISILLSLITAVSVFSFAASANEVEEEAAGNEVTVEKSGTSGTFKFDSGDWGSSKMCFYIWDATDPDHVMYGSKDGWVETNNWGSKKIRGTAVEGEDGVFESYEIDIPEGHDVYVIFHDPDTNAQTYNCILTSNAIGDTAYMTGNSIENPEDSEKTAIEARFQSAGDCGPARVITSSGKIVGDIIAPGVDRPLTVAQFVYKYYGQKEKLSGEDIVTEQTVADAIAAFETTADDVWAKFQEFNGKEGYENYAEIEEGAKKIINPSSGSDGSDSDSKDSDSDDDDDDTDSTKTNTTTTTSRSSTTATTSKSSTTSGVAATGEAAATGDATGTVAFAVVLLVAAAAIVVTRKKVQE